MVVVDQNVSQTSSVEVVYTTSRLLTGIAPTRRAMAKEAARMAAFFILME